MSCADGTVRVELWDGHARGRSGGASEYAQAVRSLRFRDLGHTHTTAMVV
jgi:hypothetical protein